MEISQGSNFSLFFVFFSLPKRSYLSYGFCYHQYAVDSQIFLSSLDHFSQFQAPSVHPFIHPLLHLSIHPLNTSTYMSKNTLTLTYSKLHLYLSHTLASSCRVSSLGKWLSQSSDCRRLCVVLSISTFVSFHIQLITRSCGVFFFFFFVLFFSFF